MWKTLVDLRKLYVQLAGFLCKHGLAWLGQFLLRCINFVMTRTYPAHFTYVRHAVWLHEHKSWAIKYPSPDIRFNADRINRDITDIYFHCYTPKLDDVCLEVGSDIGLETVFMSKLVGPNGKIFAIEAAPDTFAVLQENVADNKLINVNCQNLAISDKNGPVNISASIDGHIGNTILGPSEVIHKVTGKTMDQFIEDNQIEKIDYLKINIEGAESLLIDAFFKIDRVQNIAISCHDFLGKITGDEFYFTKNKVQKFLQNNGFILVSQSSGVASVDDWFFGTRPLK